MVDIVPIVAATLAAVSGIVVAYLRGIWRKYRIKRPPLPSDRIHESLSKLSEASLEMDNVIQEVVRDFQSRRAAVEALEARHRNLLQVEGELRERVQALQKVPLPALEYFQQNFREIERRSARRDIIMFLVGIIVTEAVTVLVRFIGLG